MPRKVAACTLVAALACLACAPARAARRAHVAVDPARVGQTVPRSFLGLSVEWDSVEHYVAGRRAAALARLLAPLARSQRGLALRLGGDSADASWWNPSRHRRPRIVLHDLTGRTLDAAAALARAAGNGPVTPGVNLALRDPGNALALVRALRARLPAGSLDAVELGNEPDLYAVPRTFRVPGAVHRRLRKHARYDPRAYGRDVARYLGVLRSGLRPVPGFAVAGFARPNWWPFVPELLDRWRGRARVLSVHMYALPYCNAPPPPSAWLMSREASRGLAAKLTPIRRLAQRRGLALRVTELNSAVCGGRRGISDRFTSAVWLADMLFALVDRDVRQVDVHTWDHALYAPFAVRGDRVHARPVFTGMRAFARAAPAGSRLVATRVTGGVRARATRDAAGTVRVALIAPRRASVNVTVPRRRCTVVWIASTRGARTGRCARSLRLPARSLAVVVFGQART